MKKPTVWLCFARKKIIGILDAPKLQIFATDIDDAAIAHAREGLYTLSDVADVSPERLRRFFTREGEHYRIRREIRETILFANHNVLKDPPFSHLDLVTCRNMLIYLNSTAQERVMETLHFALKPGGFLFLGTSESADAANDLFMPYNREYHVYRSRQVQLRQYPVPESVPVYHTTPQPITITPADSRQQPRFTYADLHLRLVEHYAPPSLVVNSDYDVVHVSELAARYLQVSGGEPSQNLLKLIRPEIRLELRTALFQATQRQSNVEVKGLKVRIDDHTETINIVVRPVLHAGDGTQGFILVLFEPTLGESSDEPVYTTSDEPVARHLEEELIRVKAQLRATVEQHEFANEELKASNEELQAMNEEMRSAAEELETSKEELQSINEELTTVNQELKVKIEELSVSTNNLQNLINSTNIGTIFLDRSYRLALFTPRARDIFNLIPSDIGRPLSDITSRLETKNVLEDADAVLEKLHMVEREVQTKEGQVYLMRTSPYRTEEDRINGVVITFIDISERKKVEERIRESEERFRLFVTASTDTIYRMSADWSRMLALEGKNFLEDMSEPGVTWMQQYIPEEDRPKVKAAIDQAIQSKRTFELEHRVWREDGSIGWTFSRAIPVLNDKGEIVEWFGAASDITAQKEAEAALHEHMDELTRFNRAMVSRESRMIELKKEVNELRAKLGEPQAYPLDFEANGKDGEKA